MEPVIIKIFFSFNYNCFIIFLYKRWLLHQYFAYPWNLAELVSKISDNRIHGLFSEFINEKIYISLVNKFPYLTPNIINLQFPLLEHISIIHLKRMTLNLHSHL